MTAESSSSEASERFTHIRARRLWGEPDEWEGSVNDPRTREEHGIRFNEKWVYSLPDGGRRTSDPAVTTHGLILSDRPSPSDSESVVVLG